MDKPRPNRFLIAYRALKDKDSDIKHLCVEAHYRSLGHAERRYNTLSKYRSKIDVDNIQILEYLTDSFFWTSDGIRARFIVDMKITNLKPLREML